MIRIHDLPDDAARHAMASGDFPPEITSSAERVAVIMTQHWCGDWLAMQSWLRRMAREGEPHSPDIDVYLLVYNKVAYFDDFRRHKETTFGNALIPYVRYYRNGVYLSDSNQLSPDAFERRFGP